MNALRHWLEQFRIDLTEEARTIAWYHPNPRARAFWAGYNIGRRRSRTFWRGLTARMRRA